MTENLNDLTQVSPAEVTERLRLMTQLDTVGSQPWPAMHQALRRSSRRRRVGASVLAAASVLAVGVASGGLPNTPLTRSQSVKPAGTGASHPTGPVTLKESGLSGPVGGSLGGDRAWIAGVRAHFMSQPSAMISPGDEVGVLWAGDLDNLRYAVIMFRTSTGPDSKQKGWYSDVLRGQAGAAPNKMSIVGGSSVLAMMGPTGNVLTTPDANFIPVGRNKQKLFVIAPKASGVEVQTGQRFSPTGKVTKTWRPLKKQGGAVWVGQSTIEEGLSTYRVTGMGKPYVSDGGEGDPGALNTQVRSIAVAGTDLPTLDRATFMTTATLGATKAELPVLATGTTLAGKNHLAATVRRSPDGGYLYGTALSYPEGTDKELRLVVQAAAISRQAFANPDAFMAAIRMNTSIPPQRAPYYLIIAPAGATTIRTGGATVPVHNRLALMPVPAAQLAAAASSGVRIQALNANGTVLGTVPPITDPIGLGAGPRLL